MRNMLMGDLDGNTERIAFDTQDIEQIITRYKANLVSSDGDPGLFLEYGNRVFPVQKPVDRNDIKPYFIVLRSGVAFNANDCQMLFNTKALSNDLLSGTDTSGKRHLCKKYGNGEVKSYNRPKEKSLLFLKNIEEEDMGELSDSDAKDLKDVIKKLRKGEFFELLTMEFSGKIKGIAKELIDFRKDIQTKIEPDIVEIAARDIPEASNQLEGINETLESSTMKIMDINDEQMESANIQYKILEKMLSSSDKGENISIGISLEEAVKAIEDQMEFLKKIEQLSLNMMEPLSFQDLVGQRIQRIIKLVRSMELRIEELIISFGIKLQKHKEDPLKSYDELNLDVEKYISDLKGPQRSGEGLDQAGIDDLLASL